jgi:hypothetical protein
LGGVLAILHPPLFSPGLCDLRVRLLFVEAHRNIWLKELYIIGISNSGV